MALLAQKQGENVVYSSFISPLSDFVMEKGLHFRHGFSVKKKDLDCWRRDWAFRPWSFWEVLENTIDYQPPPQEWHQDFPHSRSYSNFTRWKNQW